MSAEEESVTYHELQYLGHCAVHVLNNLFQEKWTTYDELIQIAYDLHIANGGVSDSIFGLNPFKSAIPFMGYFDISCIIKALEKRNCRVSEHILKVADLKSFDFFPSALTTNTTSISSYSTSSSTASSSTVVPSTSSTSSSESIGVPGTTHDIIGLLVNSEDYVWGFGRSNHWVALLKLNDNKGYANLDSKLHRPIYYLEQKGRDSGLINYLQTVLTPCNGHISGQVFVISRNSNS